VQQELIDANAAGKFGTGVTITQAGSQIQVNGNPEWRATANLTWRKGPMSVGALVSYVGPVFDTGTLLVDGQNYQLDSMTTVNTYVQYRKDGYRARFGARNAFDQKPPRSSSNYGFLGSLHDAIGRMFYVELSKEF
jgi:outer membrane receptor protein involved in Fe transport